MLSSRQYHKIIDTIDNFLRGYREILSGSIRNYLSTGYGIGNHVTSYYLHFQYTEICIVKWIYNSLVSSLLIDINHLLEIYFLTVGSLDLELKKEIDLSAEETRVRSLEQSTLVLKAFIKIYVYRGGPYDIACGKRQTIPGKV
jgi:hypothetical protein